MFEKPEKNSLSPRSVSAYVRNKVESTRLTVKQGFAKGHGRRSIRDQERDCTRATSHDLVGRQQPHEALLGLICIATTRDGGPVAVHNPQVVNVAGGLDQVHYGLRGCETILRIVSGPAVDVVDRAVKSIGSPDRRVQPAARHAMRTQEDVACIPRDQWHRDEEPDRERNGRGMDPFARGAGGRRGGGGLGQFLRGLLRRGEISRMMSRGDHGGQGTVQR